MPVVCRQMQRAGAISICKGHIAAVRQNKFYRHQDAISRSEMKCRMPRRYAGIGIAPLFSNNSQSAASYSDARINGVLPRLVRRAFTSAPDSISNCAAFRLFSASRVPTEEAAICSRVRPSCFFIAATLRLSAKYFRSESVSPLTIACAASSKITLSSSNSLEEGHPHCCFSFGLPLIVCAL